jgi:DNA mismatch endonuclease (patch repair protein)
MPDNLTKKQRSYCMSRVRVRDTDLEIAMRSELSRRGLRFRKNVTTLPGKPDVVFPLVKVAVFLDGDFWHGYRFPVWEKTLSQFWKVKISKNRQRDRRNFRKLRKSGWKVVRIWQHQIEKDMESCINRAVRAVTEQLRRSRSLPREQFN